MLNRNFLSPIICDKVPNFVKEDYPQFYRFIQDFYNFLEEEGNPLEILESFLFNLDSGNQVDGYIQKILYDIGYDIQLTPIIELKELLIHLYDFYSSRGSQVSFKFLFKFLFGVDVEISYPREKMFISSGATYSNRNYIFTLNTNRDPLLYQRILNQISGYNIQVYGVSSKSYGNVENILQVFGNNIQYFKIQIDTPTNKFIDGEALQIFSPETGEKIVENVIDVINFKISNPGYGYLKGDKIIVSSGVNKIGFGTIESVFSGSIQNINIISGGNGYMIGDQILPIKTFKGHSFSAIISDINNTGNYLSVPQNSNFQLESGDFTIECWLKKKFNKNSNVIASTYDSSSKSGWRFFINSLNYLVFEIFNNDTIFKSISKYKIDLEKWNHVATTREGDILRIFINGFKCSEIVISDGISSSLDLRIGNDSSGEFPFIGFMNEFCITKNHARYINSFSVKNSPYTSGDSLYSSISILLHMNGEFEENVFIDSSSTPKTITTHGNIFITLETFGVGESSAFFTGSGEILSIEILNNGYDYITIPELLIISDFGSGGILEGISTTIGRIKNLSISDAFVDSNDDTIEISIESKNGINGSLLPIKQIIYNELPSFKSLEGSLEINSNLLDSNYIQNYSYEIKSSIPKSNYDSVVDEWLHPSGLSRFSIIEIEYKALLNPNGLENNFSIFHKLKIQDCTGQTFNEQSYSDSAREFYITISSI